ncbi:hypothetical protein [Bacillus cereus]|uniref:hypothetical protein n=1 Tax=Bacillus cereus TaxID=1396 RepID=UPI001F4FB3AA|nr:hypothetical protein [Bacillus cereus]
MNIREWFGYNNKFTETTESDKYLDKLFVLYADALKQYFSVEDASDFNELIHNAKRNDLSRGQQLFLNWIQEKGQPQILRFVSKTVPNDKTLIATLDYEIYMLESEMDFDYPEDIVSSLMSITDLLPEIINPILESSSTEEEFVIQRNEKDVRLGNKYHFGGNPNQYYSSSYLSQKGVYSRKKYQGSAKKADSFFNDIGGIVWKRLNIINL